MIKSCTGNLPSSLSLLNDQIWVNHNPTLNVSMYNDDDQWKLASRFPAWNQANFRFNICFITGCEIFTHIDFDVSKTKRIKSNLVYLIL